MTGDEVNEVTSPGGRLGARLARLVTDARIHAGAKMAPHHKAVALSALGDFTDLMSDESKEAVQPLLKKLGESEDLTPEIRALLDFVTYKRGQWQMLVAGSATGAAFGGGLMNLITNEMNPAILRMIAGNPNNILSPSDAAAAKARGVSGPPTWDVEANKAGIDDNRFAALVELQTAFPTVDEIRELVNRQLISAEIGFELLQRNGFRHREADMVLALRHFVLSPADLSAMWNRSIIDTEEGKRLAAKSGVSEQDWHRLLELGGEPPGPQTLAEGYRRGFITREQYNRGIVQGPIRNEWFELLEKLSYSRMSTPDAADAVNQGHLSLSVGQEIAKANGLDPADFAVLIKTAGRPPGIELAQEAWLRGWIGEHQFDQMFLESAIKNEYLPLLKQARFRLIPQETVRLLYRHGVYTREDTLRTLQQHGFTETDAAAMLSLEETRQSDTTKELTTTQIRQLYSDRAIGLADATAMLLALGYSEDNARFILELGDLARVQKFMNAALSRVHAAYVAGHVDINAASATLDRLQIPPDQRDDLLALWDLERGTVSKGLTVAQITAATKKGLIQPEEAMARIVGLGYGEDDALILLKLAGAAPAENPEG